MNLFEIIKKRKENKPRTIFVSTVSSKKTSVFLPFLFQFLLIFTCLVGFVYCVTTSLQTDIPFFVVVLIVLPILALLIATA